MQRVAELLDQHVTFQLSSVDRIRVAGYIEGLAYEGGLIRFLLNRGYRLPAPAGLKHNHRRLVEELDAFVAAHDVPVVRFGKGECKEDIARPYQQAAARAGRAGVVLIGKAQERVSAWEGHEVPHPGGRRWYSYTRRSRVPDHWYSTCGMTSGARRWSSSARSRPTRCGSTPTVTSG